MTGEHQHQPLFLVAFLHALALHLLASLHAFAVTGVIGFRSQVASHAQFGGFAVQVGMGHQVFSWWAAGL